MVLKHVTLKFLGKSGHTNRAWIWLNELLLLINRQIQLGKDHRLIKRDWEYLWL